jgi:hypothetical protein
MHFPVTSPPLPTTRSSNPSIDTQTQFKVHSTPTDCHTGGKTGDDFLR